MENEENNLNEHSDHNDKFGHVVDVLHNKTKIPALRTYQGDMAEFIKEKNESVLSIAIKEKQKKDEEKQKEVDYSILQNDNKKIVKGDSLQINLTIILSAILLIFGGVVVFFYISTFLSNNKNSNQELPKYQIIPSNNISNIIIDPKNILAGFSKTKLPFGVSIIKISSIDGSEIKNSKDLFKFLNVSLPPFLDRTLKPEYEIINFSKDEKSSIGLILKVSDFGTAFSGMLDWEENMPEDLSFLVSNIKEVGSETFVWQDEIIKNKDIRVFLNKKEESKISYSFLDKNTIIITGDMYVVGEIASLFASSNFTR